MSRPIRAITQARGYNPKNHVLSIFGGAGGQHAWAIAKNLGIKKIVIHKYCGILSAYGMGLANVIEDREEPFFSEWTEEAIKQIFETRIPPLQQKNDDSLKILGF